MVCWDASQAVTSPCSRVWGGHPCAQLVETVKQTYNDGPRVNWGGGIMGPKSQAKTRKREKEVAHEHALRA